ncbi:MAG: hypothetical protein IPP27_13170 [Bacteroidetes bacterium]|nr:hypothetical protein [Bacteroidota bacterium]
MDRYKETFETWNKVALLYQEKFTALKIYDISYDDVLQTTLKNKNANLLDAGCGPGIIIQLSSFKKSRNNNRWDRHLSEYDLELAKKIIRQQNLK